MTETPHHILESDRDAAVDWLVRLARPTASEADWLAFDAWLGSAPTHQIAYDQALALWSDLEAAAPELRAATVTPFPARAVARPNPGRRWALAGGMAAAAAIALSVVPWTQMGAPTTVYVTAKGERRSVTLADGSRIDLNAGSKVSVRLTRRERQVTMDDAEAVFDVAKDASRPFVITAGDRTVRVVGTQFNVRHRDGRLAVTVARGLVEVAALGAQGELVRLPPGRRLDHDEGAPASQLSTARPEDVFSWRTGRLIYRDRPLAEVAADLNRQFSKPIQLADPATAALRFSGVLVLDDEDAVIRRLGVMAPIASTSSKNGILLSTDVAKRP
jgi:transmembrane sensor